MQTLKKKRPSGALVVAVVALAFAVVGTAVAANDGLVFPKLSKSKVKKIAKKQATQQLKANVSDSHVNLADKATNADRAAAADAAATVGGQTVHKLFTKIPSGSGTTTVLEVNGLKLSASCVTGSLSFTATTSVDDSEWVSNAANTAVDPPVVGGDRSSEFDRSDGINVIDGLSRGGGTFTYSQPNGSYVSGTFLTDDSNSFGTFDGCVVVGTAFSG